MASLIPSRVRTADYPALVMAHPGHELKLHGWLRTVRPSVHTLTTGSRHLHQTERLRASDRLCESLSLAKGAFFGEVFDADFYNVILRKQTEIVHEWTDRLRDHFNRRSCSIVVCDAWQGFSIAHDLIHVMTRIAAAEAAVKSGRDIDVFEFAPVPESLPGLFRLDKAPDEFQLSKELEHEKILAAQSMPDLHELQEYLDAVGQAELMREKFYRPRPLEDLLEPERPPLYEQYGAERVQDGHYERAILWRDVRPIVSSLLKRRRA